MLKGKQKKNKNTIKISFIKDLIKQNKKQLCIRKKKEEEKTRNIKYFFICF